MNLIWILSAITAMTALWRQYIIYDFVLNAGLWIWNVLNDSTLQIVNLAERIDIALANNDDTVVTVYERKQI